MQQFDQTLAFFEDFMKLLEQENLSKSIAQRVPALAPMPTPVKLLATQSLLPVVA